MLPKTAAEYNYTKRAFGRKMAFVVGWTLIIAMIIAASTVSLGFGGYFSQIFSVPVIPVAIAIIVIFSMINLWGIKQSSIVNIAATLIETGGLLLVIAVGAVFFNPNVDLAFSPAGFAGVMSGAALMFFAFIGFEDIANISEETRDAERIVPKALMLSIAISTILYILVALAAVSVVGWQALSASRAPMSLILGSVLGEGAAVMMSVIALFSTGNTILISLIVSSRMIYGMSRDSSLPTLLSKIHPKTKTPHVAVLLVMFVSAAFVLVGDISVIAKLTTVSIFVAYLFVNSSLIALRFKAPDERRPFRVPLNIGKFPVIALLGLASSMALLFYSEPFVLVYEAVLIIVGLALFFGTGCYRERNIIEKIHEQITK
jgi:APA family basic amino acid/polyamine antiporter